MKTRSEVHGIRLPTPARHWFDEDVLREAIRTLEDASVRSNRAGDDAFAAYLDSLVDTLDGYCHREDADAPKPSRAKAIVRVARSFARAAQRRAQKAAARR